MRGRELLRVLWRDRHLPDLHVWPWHPVELCSWHASSQTLQAAQTYQGPKDANTCQALDPCECSSNTRATICTLTTPVSAGSGCWRQGAAGGAQPAGACHAAAACAAAAAAHREQHYPAVSSAVCHPQLAWLICLLYDWCRQCSIAGSQRYSCRVSATLVDCDLECNNVRDSKALRPAAACAGRSRPSRRVR